MDYIFSQLGYCGLLCASSFAFLLHTVLIVMFIWQMSDHVIQLLNTLQWLATTCRIKPKLLNMGYNCYLFSFLPWATFLSQCRHSPNLPPTPCMQYKQIHWISSSSLIKGTSVLVLHTYSLPTIIGNLIQRYPPQRGFSQLSPIPVSVRKLAHCSHGTLCFPVTALTTPLIACLLLLLARRTGII